MHLLIHGPRAALTHARSNANDVTIYRPKREVGGLSKDHWFHENEVQLSENEATCELDKNCSSYSLPQPV